MSPSRSTTRSRISLATDAGGGSTIGLVIAVLMHAAVLVAMLFTWQHRLDIVSESAPVIPVDLVTIAQKTNVAAETRVEPKIKPEETAAPPQPADLTPPPPIPQERTEPAPQPTPQPVVIKAPPPPALPKAKPQADAKPDKFDINKLMAMVDKAAPPAPRQQSSRSSAHSHPAIGDHNAMTADLEDALRSKIEQCWDLSVISGAPHPEQLVVFVKLSLKRDGSVSGTPQLAAQSIAAAAGNPFLRAAADAAMRAIYECAPFNLPPDRYADWQDNTIKFSPQDLAGH